jgi:AcrR family transcriptional regulator
MPPTTSSMSPKQDATRQRLIDASVRRFREDGYATTTVATIAADAGVTERTFFRYFPTKADALDSVLRVVSEPSAFQALLLTVLAMEHDLAAEIGRRSGRSADDLRVRVLANACVGAFRAALRSAVARGDVMVLPGLLDDGLDAVRRLFDVLDA